MKIIKSNILSRHSEIIHGVSTMAGGNEPFYNNMSKHVGDDIIQVMKNRAVYFGSLGIDENHCAHANQVHSGNVTVISSPGLYKQTDALVTKTKGLFLIISVADCLPVMLYDKPNGVIANVHSGWRGTAAGIALNTIDKMRSEFNSNPGEIIVFLGPGIGKDKFEVGSEVAELFDEKYISIPPLFTEDGTNKYFIDLKSVVKDQLTNAGVSEQNIEIAPYCTFTEKDLLHSYRRDKDKSGRMFAVIGVRGVGKL